MTNKAFFHVIYDGPALENNEMDVRDLAPALIALADLFDEANKVLNNGRVEISTQIKASFRTGCFGIDMTVLQGAMASILNLFKEENVIAAATLMTIIGVSAKSTGGGLLGFIKWLKNRKINEVVMIDKDHVKVIVDQDSFETEKKVIELYRNARIRKALEAAISKPLLKDGVDSFACSGEIPMVGDDFFSISKEESTVFVTLEPEDEPLEEIEYEAHLQALSIAFQEDNKWRFTDGSNKFYAEMADIGFLEKIQRNDIAFRKDDLIKAKIQMRQKLTASGLKPGYKIIQVIEHRSASRQLELPFK